ncbi:hypothetical protein [Pedobacter terrae]|uniref:hypothetical protein n=1 Tax=Pedobacter terrae TaxID=405671 RepID=UPI002FFA9F48
MNSELHNVSLSKEYYPLGDRYQMANPIIVQRKAVGALPAQPVVWTHFFKNFFGSALADPNKPQSLPKDAVNPKWREN